MSKIDENNNLQHRYDIPLNLDIGELYQIMYSFFGETGWWPADTSDEIIIGSILTQNTSWKNVELALSGMKKNNLITLENLSIIKASDLESIVRPSGFFRQKSIRLVNIAKAITQTYGKIDNMKDLPLEEVQNFLSSLKGVGQETMDCILLYVLDKPQFVVDKYTMRILDRIGYRNLRSVEDVKQLVSNGLGANLHKMKNMHGMFVELAKNHCRVKPVCNGCPIKERCDYGSENY